MTNAERLTLICAFVGAAYDYQAIRPSLFRYTADVHDGVVHLQLIVARQIGEDDLDDLRCIGTDVIAAFPHDHTLDEQIIAVDDPAEVAAILPLPLGLFRRGAER